jgi:hypothetical protein
MRGALRKFSRNERGFALAMVVFLLFAAAIAGLTGYQVVGAEASLAEGNENQDEALAVANAGMARYVGEHIGIPGSATYAVGDGSVTITPKKVAKLNDSTDLYLLTSVGTVTDPRYPTSPATRTLRQYANLNRRPVKQKASFMTIQSTVSLGNQGGNEVTGTAYFATSAAVDCPSGDNSGVGSTGGIALPNTSVGGSTAPTGSPAIVSYGSAAALIAAAALRWSVLKDPTFPIPYDGTWPNFSSIPSDSFPVIRVNGSYTMDRNGRGALIVTGNFYGAGTYEWQGIILAGGAASSSYNSGTGAGPTVKGVVVSGLDGTAFGGNQQINRWHSIYYPCWVRRANLALAYLTPVSRSAWTY